MFSVVIPLYNKRLSIRNTVETVLNQTFKEFEVIIVNDGSTDDSLEIVKQIQDPRIRIIDKTNGGVSSARNRGINEAKFEWIAFLDADDLWEENHLEVLYQLIRNYSENKVFCTSYIRSFQKFSVPREYGEELIADYFLYASTGFFWSSVACIHKEVFEKVGNFNTSLNRGEDLELWSRIGRDYSFVKSKVVTAVYRVEAENRSDKIDYNINKSFLSLIDLKKAQSTTERRYLRRLLYKALMRFLRQADIRNALVIIKKLI